MNAYVMHLATLFNEVQCNLAKFHKSTMFNQTKYKKLPNPTRYRSHKVEPNTEYTKFNKTNNDIIRTYLKPVH